MLMSTLTESAPVSIDPTSPAKRRSDYQRLADLVRTSALREQIAVISPLDGTTVGTIPHCSAEDVETAVQRARTAQSLWAALPLSERVKPFIAAHTMFLDSRYAFSDIIQLENGKSRVHALLESFDAAINSRYYAFNARKYIGTKRVLGAFPPFTRTTEVRHPWGVVGMISPWNYPLTLTIPDVIPALIAGNTVVLKPSELTPFTVLMGLELLRKAGVPEDVFQVVTGEGHTTGSALVERSDFVMFTGSTAVGRKVAEQCARRLIPYSMELGGKNPAIILDDVDVDKSIAALMDGTIVGGGQTCVSYERLYVHDKVYDTFVPRLAEAMKATKLGTSLTDMHQDMGPLISQTHFQKVKSHVDDAKLKGARVLAGGNPRPEFGPTCYEPTLLENVTPDMTLYGIETFGPVLSVYRVASDAEAVAACNDSPFGLHASVFGRNTRRAHTLAQQIHAGTVSINENYKAVWASMNSTQGGFKQSGSGRRHGREGITKYTQTQNISTQYVLPLSPSRLLPPERWDRFFGLVLRVMRYIPGLR